MKLLITSLYFLNDFQIHKSPLKLTNFLYQYDDIYIAFIHTNLYHQNKIIEENNNLSLNNLEEFLPNYKGYTLKMIYYKQLFDYLSSIKNEIKEVKVVIPNDKYLQFNAEILMNELSLKNYMLETENNIDIKTEEEIDYFLNFNNFYDNMNIESNLYQKLLYFQYRMDVSYFIKRTFLQKSTIKLNTINLDTLLISKLLSEKYEDNLTSTTIDNEEIVLNKLRFLDNLNQQNMNNFTLNYNYSNISMFINLNMDKDKIDIIKRKRFKKFNDIYVYKFNNDFYISKIEPNFLTELKISNKLTLNDLVFYLKKYNSLTNIVWNLRQISSEIELDNNGLIIDYFSNLERLNKFIKTFDVFYYVDDFLETINKKIKNKDDFKNFIKNEYKTYFIKIIGDLNLYMKQDQKPIGICPICQKDFVYENEKSFYCMTCNFKLFKNTLNHFKLKDLTRLEMKDRKSVV